MPINTAMQYVYNALYKLPLPGDIGTLDTYITPFNPNDEAKPPGAYVWGSRGNEVRLSLPRAAEGNLGSGANKEITHSLDVWLIWFGPNATDPNADTAFPSVIDAVMARLRNVSLIDADQHAVDPITGQESALLTVAENMSYEYGPVRAVLNQRTLRYNALVTCEIVEVIQA